MILYRYDNEKLRADAYDIIYCNTRMTKKDKEKQK